MKQCLRTATEGKDVLCKGEEGQFRLKKLEQKGKFHVCTKVINSTLHIMVTIVYRKTGNRGV